MQSCKPLDGFEQHVVLYSKGWYGKKNNIIEDLKILLAKYAGLELAYISERDIFQMLITTYIQVTNELSIYQKTEWLMEITGKKWGYPFNEKFNRKPEEVLLGAISVCDGEFVNTSELFKITFA